MTDQSNTLPRFFIVDGVPVKLVAEGDEVAGYTYNGTPFGLGKALEGKEISKDEYDSIVAGLLNS